MNVTLSPPKRGSLKKETLSDQVHERLLADIMSGVLRPGDRIIEKKVSAELNVSNAPVREAIKRLVAEGLVATSSYTGAVVRERPIQEMLDVYEVRVLLECHAIRLAVSRGVPDPLVERLRSIHRQMCLAATREEIHDLVALDLAFHRTIFEAGGNAYLTTTALPILTQIGAMISVSNLIYWDNLHEVADTHLPLIEVLRGADVPKAQRAVVEHSGRVWERAADRHPWLRDELQDTPLLLERFRHLPGGTG
jgi:DNA-binding GntR family transcriptional regulator